MNSILTLVSASAALDEVLMGEACARLGAVPGRLEWLAPRKAAAVEIGDAVKISGNLRAFLDERKTDIFITPEKNRRKKIFLADMDATIVTGETLDELAAFAGFKEQVAAITARAMEGKIDFEGALRERVALLKDLETGALNETLKNMKLSPGAKILVSTLKKHGCSCVLVSGGFTFFTGAVAGQCGFDFHHGNTLDIESGLLAGTVSGAILDKNAKAAFLEQYREKFSLRPEDTMTMGDGANDIPMLKAAGLGIGYRPKDAVRKEISNLILHNDLTAALYAQGYREDEFMID